MSKAKHSKCLNDEGELYLRQGGCLCQYRASAIDIVCQCLARQGRHLNCVTLSMDIRYKPRPSSLTSASEQIVMLKMCNLKSSGMIYLVSVNSLHHMHLIPPILICQRNSGFKLTSVTSVHLRQEKPTWLIELN